MQRAQGMDGGQGAQQGAFDGSGAQLNLDGMPPVRRATDRLFFAVRLDARAAVRIAALAAQLARQRGPTGTCLPAEGLHVRLHHPGDFGGLPQRGVQAAQAAPAQAVDAPAAGGSALLRDRAASCDGRRDQLPFVLLGGAAPAGTRQFQQRLVTALHRAPPAPDAPACAAVHGFEPHLTLLHDAIRVAEHAVEPVGRAAREVAPVRSLPGRSTHTALARRPLP